MEAHEAHEVGDTIAEGGHEAHAEASFRRVAAVTLGIMAMLLAIASLFGEAAMKDTINFNIKASDTYAFYQAKNERQTTLQLAADQLTALAASHPEWSGDARANVDKLIADYRATVTRYESDPKTGEGKKELLAKARGFEEKRDRAQHQDSNYDYARALFQIAIVLGSVSIVALSRPLLWLGCGLAGLALILALNGYILFVTLPLE
ncbi:MAG: DUF4337 domain-containing protein [Stellaceae bacterium]